VNEGCCWCRRWSSVTKRSKATSLLTRNELSRSQPLHTNSSQYIALSCYNNIPPCQLSVLWSENCCRKYFAQSVCLSIWNAQIKSRSVIPTKSPLTGTINTRLDIKILFSATNYNLLYLGNGARHKHDYCWTLIRTCVVSNDFNWSFYLWQTCQKYELCVMSQRLNLS